MQVDGTRMYRVKDVAEHFEVSVSTIYRAIESGQLSALKLGTGLGTLRVPGLAVLAYAETCGPVAYEASVPGQPAGAELVGEVAR
jgi:excisionase family DNA binding protein